MVSPLTCRRAIKTDTVLGQPMLPPGSRIFTRPGKPGLVRPGHGILLSRASAATAPLRPERDETPISGFARDRESKCASRASPTCGGPSAKIAKHNIGLINNLRHKRLAELPSSGG